MMTSCCLLVAALRVLYPSDAFRLETTSATSSWPGRHVSATAGAVDLSSAGEISISLSNRLERALKVTLSVKSRALQGRSPGAGVTLPPHGVGTIVCDLDPEPWRLDAPLELVGMNGFPKARDGHSSLFDVRAVTSFHLFAAKGVRPDAFDVLRVSAQDEVARKVVVYSAKTFLRSSRAGN